MDVTGYQGCAKGEVVEPSSISGILTCIRFRTMILGKGINPSSLPSNGSVVLNQDIGGHQSKRILILNSKLWIRQQEASPRYHSQEFMG